MSDKPTLPEGPGFGLTFLYYFSGIALVTTFLAVKTLGVGLETGIPNQFGLAFGAIGGVLGATFNRSKILNVPFKSKKVFDRKLDAALTAMGYTEDPNANLEGIQVYRRSTIRQLFSGKIYVLVDDQQARISSRASHIRGLRRKLTQD
jgi:hypothetical protein